jgi:alginate O-acetyltransferase complex protein AlgI
MLFNSPVFVVFFVVVFALYWLLRSRLREQNLLLLVASYIFYGAWSWKFLLLLIATTLLDYTCGRLLAASADGRLRRLILLTSVIVNLGILAAFKYFGFFVRESIAMLESLGYEAHAPVLEIVLPVGISFYTFQSIGYVVDVYRGKVPAERSLLDYALYVSFFPQLVAGPIERAGHLLPQIKQARSWSTHGLESGVQLALWGLFKKVAIADNLAPYVDAVYSDPGSFSGRALATATVFFAFQIYCDFSGYTDTARGVARMLGFELIRNFEHPYVSRTPVEFWRRWHISLSQWFQDYLYFPLAMRAMRKGGWGSKYLPHVIAMMLIGFWHGANWTFVVFGLYWGLAIVLYLYGVEHARKAVLSDRARKVFSVAAMFVVVCVGWVFFRAESMTDATTVLGNLFSAAGEPAVRRAEVVREPLLWGLIALLLLAEWVQRNRPKLVDAVIGGSAPALAWRYALIVAIVFSYVVALGGAAQPFIYFQF